jgi:hypothetical protein
LKSLVAATVGLFAAGTHAQTGTVTDLGTLLAGNSNLTTYTALIKVSCVARALGAHTKPECLLTSCDRNILRFF